MRTNASPTTTTSLCDYSRLTRMRSLLGQIKLLRGSPLAALDELAEGARIIRCGRGETIAPQSDPQRCIFLVSFGRVRLRHRSDNGRELILNDVQAGEWFGEESLSGEAAWRSSAVALDETTVVAVEASQFAAFLSMRPRTALNFALQLAQRLSGTRAALASVALHSVEERLLSTLEQLDAAGDDFPTHAELAARVGACRETVTRTLTSLTRRGLLVAGGGRYVRR